MKAPVLVALSAVLLSGCATHTPSAGTTTTARVDTGKLTSPGRRYFQRSETPYTDVLKE